MIPMDADSVVFISHKQSGPIPDGVETASAMIADELRYMKTRLYTDIFLFRNFDTLNSIITINRVPTVRENQGKS